MIELGVDEVEEYFKEIDNNKRSDINMDTDEDDLWKHNNNLINFDSPIYKQ